MLKKKYNISLHFGNTQKTILEMDIIDVYYGLSKEDKDDLLWEFINGAQTKNEIYSKNARMATKSKISNFGSLSRQGRI
jgi:hypothetical protein